MLKCLNVLCSVTVLKAIGAGYNCVLQINVQEPKIKKNRQLKSKDKNGIVEHTQLKLENEGKE